jgi:hypothetical protein
MTNRGRLRAIRIEGAIPALAAILLAFFLIAFAYRVWTVTRFPYTIEYGEGPVLDWVRELARGRWPYKPIDTYPYTFSVYTPLFLWLSSLLLHAGGPVLLGGRVVSAGGILVSAWAVYALARHEGAGRKLAWIGALLFLASPFAYRWATFYRPDALALALSLAGVVLAFPYTEPGHPVQAGSPRLLGASVLFLAAFFTKQSFVAAPASVAIMVLVRDRRRGAAWTATTAAAGGLVFLLLNAATGGTFFTDVVLGNVNPYSFSAFLGFFARFSVITLVLFGAGIAEAGIRVWERGPSLTGVYLLLALLTALSAGKAGAWENYFLETLALLCIWSALAADRFVRRFGDAGWKLILVFVIVQLALFATGFERLGPAAEARWLRQTAETQRELSAWLAQVPDPVVAEDMGVLAVNDRPVPIHTFVYTQLARQGVWNPAPFLDDLANHRFPLLILRRGARADIEGYDRFSPAMLSAIELHYACAEDVRGFELCTPTRSPQLYDGELAHAVRLMGYDIAASPTDKRLRPGGRVTVTLLWETESRLPADYTVFVHVVGSQGNRWGQHDGPPREGTFPTSRWRPGDIVRDVHRIPLNEMASAGPYRLLVGMYSPSTGERLPVTRGQAFENALVIIPPHWAG